LVWVAVLLIVLIGLTGLALDWGYVAWTGGQLQTAADAAAIAGAAHVRHDIAQARTAAVDLAGENEAAGQPVALNRNDAADTINDPSGDIVIGRYDREARRFTAVLNNPNAVRVVARRTPEHHGGVPLFFGPWFGKATSSASRQAVAMVGGSTGAGMLVLDSGSTRRAFYVRGNAQLDVSGGTIHINSRHTTEAGRLQGSPTVNAPAISTPGNVRMQGAIHFDGEVKSAEEPVNDPLAHLSPPAAGAPRSPRTIDTSGLYEPGYYPDGLELSGGDVTLNSGVYTLENGFHVSGNTHLVANDVLFYVAEGSIRVTGSATLSVTPRQRGLYKGISFFQARNNSSTATLSGTGRIGGGGLGQAGLLYVPNAKVAVGGTSDLTLNQLIAHRVEVFGTGRKTIHYQGDVPAAGTEVFLVR
jgi:hypothetical protein